MQNRDVQKIFPTIPSGNTTVARKLSRHLCSRHLSPLPDGRTLDPQRSFATHNPKYTVWIIWEKTNNFLDSYTIFFKIPYSIDHLKMLKKNHVFTDDLKTLFVYFISSMSKIMHRLQATVSILSICTLWFTYQGDNDHLTEWI